MKQLKQTNMSYIAESIISITPEQSGIKLNDWLLQNKAEFEPLLKKHGALLFRQFDVTNTAQFADIAKIFSPELLEYKERSTPRTEVEGNIYTSTEYPNDQYIPMHNESSYSAVWPMKIWFCCQTKADEGGETPIADSREMFRRLDPKIKQKFMDQKVMYLRNFDGNLDLPWQNVFQTDNKDQVEKYCLANGIDFEWVSDNHLRTRTVRQAIATHPSTKEVVWFNQANLFHVSSLPVEAREWLIEERGLEGLPRNTYFGDGTIIPDSMIEEIQGLYKEVSRAFPWEEGDVLMLDNMLMAHGRNPFKGKRKVVVAMAEPQSLTHQ